MENSEELSCIFYSYKNRGLYNVNIGAREMIMYSEKIYKIFTGLKWYILDTALKDFLKVLKFSWKFTYSWCDGKYWKQSVLKYFLPTNTVLNTNNVFFMVLFSLFMWLKWRNLRIIYAIFTLQSIILRWCDCRTRILFNDV